MRSCYLKDFKCKDELNLLSYFKGKYSNDGIHAKLNKTKFD